MFVLWELITPEPMLDVRLFRNLTFSVSLIATSIVMVSMFAAVFLISLYTQNLQGIAAQAGSLQGSQDIMTSMLLGVVQQQAAAAAMSDTLLVASVMAAVGMPLVFFLGKKRVEAARLLEEQRYREQSGLKMPC